MAAEPELPWTEEAVKGEGIGKKDIITWLQEHASFAVRYCMSACIVHAYICAVHACVIYVYVRESIIFSL